MNAILVPDPLHDARSLHRLLILQNGIFWLFIFVSMGLVFPLTLLYLQKTRDRKAPGIDLTRV